MEVLAEQSKNELNTVSELGLESSRCQWLVTMANYEMHFAKCFMNKAGARVLSFFYVLWLLQETQ